MKIYADKVVHGDTCGFILRNATGFSKREIKEQKLLSYYDNKYIRVFFNKEKRKKKPVIEVCIGKMKTFYYRDDTMTVPVFEQLIYYIQQASYFYKQAVMEYQAKEVKECSWVWNDITKEWEGSIIVSI